MIAWTATRNSRAVLLWLFRVTQARAIISGQEWSTVVLCHRWERNRRLLSTPLLLYGVVKIYKFHFALVLITRIDFWAFHSTPKEQKLQRWTLYSLPTASSREPKVFLALEESWDVLLVTIIFSTCHWWYWGRIQGISLLGGNRYRWISSPCLRVPCWGFNSLTYWPWALMPCCSWGLPLWYLRIVGRTWAAIGPWRPDSLRLVARLSKSCTSWTYFNYNQSSIMYRLPSSFKINSPQKSVEHVLHLQSAVLGEVSAVHCV